MIRQGLATGPAKSRTVMRVGKIIDIYLSFLF